MMVDTMGLNEFSRGGNVSFMLNISREQKKKTSVTASWKYGSN